MGRLGSVAPGTSPLPVGNVSQVVPARNIAHSFHGLLEMDVLGCHAQRVMLLAFCELGTRYARHPEVCAACTAKNGSAQMPGVSASREHSAPRPARSITVTQSPLQC